MVASVAALKQRYQAWVGEEEWSWQQRVDEEG
jgi:hypothetical protein